MARIVPVAVVAGLVMVMTANASAQMAVRDDASIIQQIKNGIEEAKTYIKMTELYTLTSNMFDVAKETMSFTKDVKDTIGPMVSLGLTASSWMRSQDSAMACLVPNLGMFNINFDVTSICSGIEWAGSEFGLPMSGGDMEAQRRSLLYGRYSWTGYLRNQSKGNGGGSSVDIGRGNDIKASPAEWAQLREDASTTKAKRQALASQANLDSVGIALAMATNGTGGVAEAIDSVAEMSGVTTLQERVGHTNKILARIIVNQERQTQILAKLLLVLAADKLKDEPVLYDMPEATWLDAGAKR